MRIGLVTGEYPPMHGGVGAYSRLLVKELARQGNTVHVLSNQNTRSDDTEVQIRNTIHQWGIGSLGKIGQWAAEQRLDIVNLQFQTAAFGMSPWIHFLPDFLRHMPVVTTFHDLRYPYLFPKAAGLREWIVMHLARASEGAIVTNHEDYQRIRQVSKSVLIPIGSNILKPLPADFDRQAWRTKAGAEAGDFVMAYFGLFNHSKGLPQLFQALASLHDFGMPIHLIIIGGESGSSDPTNIAFSGEMDALIEKLSLRPFVYRTGFLGDDTVGTYLTASDAVILPFLDGASYRRGSLMAALYYGCAIVTTTPSVPISTFEDGQNMLLVPPGNSQALAEAIRRLFDSPDLRERLKSGAARLAQHFDWSQIARNIVEFFRWVIEESR